MRFKKYLKENVKKISAPVPKHTESEVQGRGRRYWFKNEEDANRFGDHKKSRGHHVSVDGRTVWASHGKKLTQDAIDVIHGKDPD